MTLLSVDNLGAGYGELQVVWDVSFKVEPGQVVVLAGPNGAGKSTLLKAIAGTLRPLSGSVTIADRDVTTWSHSKRLRSGIGWVPEGRLLFDELPVEENLRMSARLAGIRTKDDFQSSLETTIEVFPELVEWLARPAGQLSGGQQQIVAVARGLIRRPKLMLLDEPSVGIAPRVISMMSQRLEQMASFGVGILIAEQNVAWLSRIADEAIVIRGGEVVHREVGSVLGSRDFMRDVYLSVSRTSDSLTLEPPTE